MTTNTIITTREQIQKVFAEWCNMYLSSPEEFTVITQNSAAAQADYFIELLHKVT